MNLLEQSSRVALASLLHDLGKLTERARVDYPQSQIDLAVQFYAKKNHKNGATFYSHKHVAYSALSIEELSSDLPFLTGVDFFPFASALNRNADDSLINAAAKHHRPETLLQWIIAKADRTASGFERESFEGYNQSKESGFGGKNHYQARLLSLFEQVDLTQQRTIDKADSLSWRMPLEPLTVASQFPRPHSVEPDNNAQAQAQYRDLWESFKRDLKKIPDQMQSQLALWLDQFDSVLLQNWHAIPSATAFGARPDVSLYDHTKVVAALATALWRYVYETQTEEGVLKALSSWDKGFDLEPTYLLVQGDFFGIQNFIFNHDEVGNSQKESAKLLRGRSFMVSLLTELAAIKILDALDLPGTSQMMNAAGKFMIVAPNTVNTRNKIKEVEGELNTWFMQETYGQSGFGIAVEPVSHQDFTRKSTTNGESDFSKLMQRLFNSMETKKFRRFGLLDTDQTLVFKDYLPSVSRSGGVCSVNGRYPADGKDGHCQLVDAQVELGALLAKNELSHLVIHRNKPHHSYHSISLLGFHIRLISKDDALRLSQSEALKGDVLRLFDVSHPKQDKSEGLFDGFARRFIRGYMPLFEEVDQMVVAEKYANLDEDEKNVTQGTIKTFHHLACENRQPNASGRWQGIRALNVLKGDVDNLGLIFQKGLVKTEVGSACYSRNMTFAKMASLSRLMNQFFTVYVPWLCATKFTNTYTVFAGGDDFFLIGPWREQMKLAQQIRKDFSCFCAQNSQLTFSVGLATIKAKVPIHQMSEFAEKALEAAKEFESDRQSKNAVTVFGQVMAWSQFFEAEDTYQKLLDLKFDLPQVLSTGYVYGLLNLCDMAHTATQPALAQKNPEVFSWRSRLVYRTRRLFADLRLPDTDAQNLIHFIAEQMNRQPMVFKTVIHTYLYQHRF